MSEEEFNELEQELINEMSALLGIALLAFLLSNEAYKKSINARKKDLIALNKALAGIARKEIKDFGSYDYVTTVDQKKLPAYVRNAIKKASALKVKDKKLREAYLNLLKKGSEKRKNLALKVRADYYMRRIIRYEGFKLLNYNTAITLSKASKYLRVVTRANHAETDICLMHTDVNYFGLGKGVYPADKCPLPPFRPNCRCRVKKYSGNGAAGTMQTEKQYLRGFSEKEKTMIAGSKEKYNDYKSGTGTIVDSYYKGVPSRNKVRFIKDGKF